MTGVGVALGVRMARWRLQAAQRERMERIESCAFVRGVRDGTLPPHVYERFAAQDAIFLDAFARQYCVLAARAPKWTQLVALHALAAAAIEERTQLHHAFSSSLSPAQATLRYVEGMQRLACSEPVPLASLAALAPCMSVYAHLGRILCKDPLFQASCLGAGANANPYKAWVDTYAHPAFQAQADRIEMLLSEIEGDAKDSCVDSFMDECYSFAMDMELEFFDAAFVDGVNAACTEGS